MAKIATRRVKAQSETGHSAVVAEHTRFKASSDPATGAVSVEVDHADPATGEALMLAALGVSDSVAASWLIEQLTPLAIVKGEMRENLLNRHVALVQEIAPNDATEAMLACQMSAVHTMTMAIASEAQRSTGKALDLALGQLNKLARTFSAQMETLKRYRGTGEQRVIVEHRHYHLAPGAQAVFGDVHSREGGDGENRALPHESPLPLPNGLDGSHQTTDVEQEGRRQ